MKADASKRNAWVACPQCGQKVARVRTCDMEVKCRACGHEYEVVIVSASGRVREDPAPYGIGNTRPS
jgi:hypothetical protein